MPGVITPLPRTPIGSSEVALLRPEDVPMLRLPGRRATDQLRKAIVRRPNRSVWIPETLEYAAIGCWRNRPEISSIEELVAVRNVEPLIRSAAEQSFELGDDLLLAVELESQPFRSRYERAGMEMLEEVITYEIDVSRVPRMPQKHLRFIRVLPHDPVAVDQVTLIDQSAFPWLWRNSRAEFDVYLDTPGVSVSFVVKAGLPVAYVGTTVFTEWGHLDRIAVAPEHQGRGFGRAALILAIDSLRQRGARRVALSTQRTNTRSQHLYERFGFRRTPDLDYRLFGTWSHPGGLTIDRPV